MEIKVLGSFGGSTRTARLTNFLINNSLALDAGCLTQTLSLKQQHCITNVIISHSHMDHITSLPFLVDNLFGQTVAPLNIWGSTHVIHCLRTHIFNDVIWPDFTKIQFNGTPSILFHTLTSRTSFSIGDLQITPIPVNHIVPTHALYIEDQNGGFLFSSDTSTTDEIWQFVNQKEKLKAIIVDCSFPNEMEDLAIMSGHMTPTLLARDLKKLESDCDIYIYHAKSSFEKLLHQQLDDLNLSKLHRNIQGQIITV